MFRVPRTTNKKALWTRVDIIDYYSCWKWPIDSWFTYILPTKDGDFPVRSHCKRDYQTEFLGIRTAQKLEDLIPNSSEIPGGF